MAKKNLSSLMSGIMGTDERERETDIVDLPKEETQTSLEPELSAPAVRRPGHPKKYDSKKEIRATFIVNPELVRKIKYISLIADRLQKDIIDAALSEYISNWEAEHGKIKI